MRYKVGDKVRVRGDLEVNKKYGEIVFLADMKKGEIFDVLSTEGEEGKICGLNDTHRLYYSSEMLRPAEFKIWCETDEEKQAVLEELEKEGYVWYNSKEKPTEKDLLTPVGILVWKTDFENDTTITYTKSIENFDKKEYCQFTPSEFTGIDFSEKIIIKKTDNGASGTYGSKTAEAKGEFVKSAGQVLAKLICPFRLEDKVSCEGEYVGQIKGICSDCSVLVILNGKQRWYEFDELELYKEPLFSGRAVRIEPSSNGFSRGKIYEFVNGIVCDDDGYDRPIPSRTIRNEKDLQEYGFLAIVEDK